MLKITIEGFGMKQDLPRKNSSIILLNDDFESIVNSIILSRNIYDMIRKYLQF